MNWIKDLKIAIISEDIEAIDRLTRSIPDKFETAEKIEEAMMLTKEAQNMIKDRRDNLSMELKKLKNARNYISQ